MRVTLTITDKRRKQGSQYAHRDEWEEYERVSIDATGPSSVVGAVLRGVADDADPTIEAVAR